MGAAVLGRQRQVPFWRRLRSWVWPSMGWARTGRYILTRLGRLGATPHSIAAGFACGVATGITPLLGLHIILGVLLAYIVRGDYLAVVVGTTIANPWTFPFICVANYELGQLLLGGPVGDPWAAVGLFKQLADELFGLLWPLLTGAVEQAQVARVARYLSQLVWPMLIGSLPLSILAALLVYRPILRLVEAFHGARQHRRERRLAERARRAAAGALEPRAGISSPGQSRGPGL